MSIAIWPPISPEQLKIEEAETQVRRPPLLRYCLSQQSPREACDPESHYSSIEKMCAETSTRLVPKTKEMLIQLQERELVWITEETVHICRELKNGLDDCYALLAPIDPGSTLVMSTPRNEKVKGTLTRVGTRIVKGVRLYSEVLKAILITARALD